MADLSPDLQKLFGRRFLPGYWTSAYNGYTSPWMGGGYDPYSFVAQGRPPGTPGANADVANQSQVVRTPQEVAEEKARLEIMEGMRRDKQIARSQAYQAAQKPINDTIAAYQKSSPNDITQAIKAAMGGVQDSISLGLNPNNGASVTGYYANSPEGSIPIPQEYIPDDLSARDYNTIGSPFTTTPSRQLKGADLFASDVSSDIVSAIRSGGTPVIPDNLAGVQGIQDAVKKFQDTYSAYQALPAQARSRDPRGSTPPPTGDQRIAQINQQSQQFQSGLNSSYQNYLDQTQNNWQTQNQAYLDQLGGAFPGGVLPNAWNPQWYDTTATWNGNDTISGDAARQAAQGSPMGQPGAPFASQSWAWGGPQGPQAPQGGHQSNSWSGPVDSFSPVNFNPSLATNAPWASTSQQQPQQPQWPGGGGMNMSPSSSYHGPQATQTNKMTFGQSPWGSFW
jgi:hypothetical protein